eukprot:1161220-Pelagomonas_calceolata.AAC.13
MSMTISAFTDVHEMLDGLEIIFWSVGTPQRFLNMVYPRKQQIAAMNGSTGKCKQQNVKTTQASFCVCRKAYAS